eukprot:CAMPEP_0116838890 /NCGR_PEP_ID=MMETSP0418-20121206/9465_1 /TAXON_ID=1158023 /ORGANISM="Astrosyne radiata, Strain 13vi08-1A" /LENGTH=246 /DNA_ID=CAMNT_0004468945 /DNA_START=16 /DNA_END=756 /DNA_ORIENTATION=-
MRLNYETCITGRKCVLVPYRPEHVGRYHEWMQDSNLLELTGSEPLTMEQELEMQISWRDDEDKCTFIVLARDACTLEEDATFVVRNLEAMVGDVNLFLSNEEEDGDDDDALSKDNTISCNYRQAEIDIMIAEKEYRKKGLGREATCLMMLFGAIELGLRRVFCKIHQDNQPSRNLFERNLGFVECDYAECFRQYELELKKETPEALIAHLKDLLSVDALETFSCPIQRGVNNTTNGEDVVQQEENS